MNDNVIPFILKDQIYVMEFNTPMQIRMHKTTDCNIQLELERGAKDLLGYGKAWVPASTKEQARRKLLDLLNATNIKFIGD